MTVHKCSVCNGSGLERQRDQWMEWREEDCTNCNGTGQIIIKDEDEDAQRDS